MEPTGMIKQIEKNGESPIFQKAADAQVTLEQEQQEQRLQTNEMMLEKKGNIVGSFSKNIPMYSLELEKQLQEGPPPELGKFQKAQWSSNMKSRIQEEKKRERSLQERKNQFFAPADNLMADMVHRQNALPENANVEQIATAFTGCMATAKEIDLQKLIKDSSDISPEILSLKDIFAELSKCNAQSFTAEQAKNYTDRYHALGMEVNAATSRYLDEAGIMEPASCYVVLYHCVTQMLQYHLNMLDEDKVDATEFSKLYAKAAVTGLAANTIVLSQDYRERRKNHLEQQAAKAAEIEREARNREIIQAARRQYLYTGISAQGTTKSWPLSPYAGIAERILGESLYTLSDKELGLAIQRMEENLEANTAAANIFYRSQMKEKPALAGLQDFTLQNILLNMGNSLLTERVESDSDIILNALTKFTDEHADRIELYEKRMNQLKAMPPLDMLSDELLHIEITSMIYKLEDPETFAVAASDLQQQAQKNIDIAKEIISQKVTHKNQDAALQTFVKRSGQLLLLGAAAAVFVETEYFLEHLQLFAPQVVYEENVLRKKIQDAGIDSCWISAVSKQISDSNLSPDEEKQELQKLKENIESNQNTFDKEINDLKKSSAQWQQLFQWQAENITLSSGEFAQALQDFLCQDEMQSAGDLTKDEYINGQAATVPIMLKKDKASNVHRLRGKDLCRWNGFGEFLRGEEKAVMSALEQALQEKHLPWAVQKNINTLNDLNLLPLREYTDFLTLLRSNIGKAIVEWKNIGGPYPHEIRGRLLKELICGELTKENILVRASEEEVQLKKQSEAERLRFLSYMGSNASHTGEVRYLHLKETATTAITGSDSRAVRRNERFQVAKKIWDEIRTENLENVIHDYWVKAQGNEHPVKFIRDTLDKRISEIKAANKRADDAGKAALTEEIQTLNKLDKLIKSVNDEDCEREFMLRGMEGELLSFTEAGESFTSQEREDYDATLLKLEKVMIPRYEELDRMLKKIFENNPAQIQGYHDKAKKLLTGLEPLDGSVPTEEQKERNRARFGVSDWAEALQEIEKMVTPANNSLRKQAENAAALLENRTKQLTTYKGGILKPFYNVILENREAFQILMTGEEEGVSQYLDVLEQQFSNPYKALQRYNPEGIFAQQFVIEKQNLLWSKGNAALDFWKTEVESYYRAYCTYEIKGTSIDSRYRKLSESNKTLAPYLMQIIFADTEGISMLLSSNEAQLDSKLKVFEKHIAENSVSLDNFLRELQDTKTLGLRTGFILYLQTKIPFMEGAEFQSNLSKWWKDFQELDASTQEETKKSVQVLKKRAQTMLDIESKKQRGIEADLTTQTFLNELQNQKKCAPSPVLLMLGHNQMLNEKEVADKKEEIYKIYNEQPAIIQDILLESSLLGTDLEQLAQEEAWLSTAYEKILNTAFAMGGDSIHIDGDAAKELLMVAFAKWKTSRTTSTDDKGTVPVVIAEDMLQTTFRTLADGHRLLQELSDLNIQDAGLLMERDHLVETLAAGMYRMSKEEFENFILKRTSYIKASSLALTVFREETADFGSEQASLCSGLREYFHEDLLKGEGELNLPTLRKQTKSLLKSKHIRQFLENSNSLMGKISSTDEIKVTSVHHTLEQKHDLESYLSSLPDNTAFQRYSQLDLAQRQIFAMALGAPGQEELCIPNARFMKNEKSINAVRIQMQEQLQRYIHHNTFTPVVDYTSALLQLKNPDGTINESAFLRAMDFTNVVTAQRLQNIPIDWERMGDGASVYEAAKRLTGQTADSKQLAVTSMEEFIQKISTADEESSRARSLKKELQTLSQHQMQLLVHGLTDRTILDRTTKITAKDRAKGVLHSYANSEKRAEMMEIFIHEPNVVAQNGLSSQELSAAMASLMSYQLRDDIMLTGRNLHENDFAVGALERKTVIDWNLLSEALAFVHEVEQETLRLSAIKQAGVLIRESKNEAAIEEYEKQQQAELSTQEDFEKYLLSQAKKDGMSALYAGYQQLGQQERALFVKALSQRHLLDISKVDINLNRLGMAEREYADRQGRNALLDEYMESSKTQDGTVALDENSYRQAVYMTLSTQISDDVDFSQMKGQSLATYLTSFSNPFKRMRQTAVDWKLVQRALQFVHRAANEKDIFRQDRELYVSQGNLLDTGHFTFDAAHLRKNIHNAGSRFGRYLRRRVQDELLGQIPAYLKPILKQAITKGREQLSAAYADRITKLGIFDDDEDSSVVEKASTLMEWEDSFYKDFFEDITKERLGVDAEKTFRDKVGNLSNTISYLNAGITGFKVAYNFYQLNTAQKESQAALAEDQKQTVEAAKHQTMQQQDLSNKAIERNFNLQEQGRTKSRERQADTIIDTVTEVIGTATIEDDQEMLKIAVTEAGKLINFIRNYINDKSSVVKFFSTNGELEKMRNAYSSMEWEGEKEELKDIELIRQMKGYENYTELATFVGLNITRSLLFCAGKYNPQKHLRYLAVATLATIDMTDAIGHQDSETAERVFNALMGSDYR